MSRKAFYLPSKLRRLSDSEMNEVLGRLGVRKADVTVASSDPRDITDWYDENNANPIIIISPAKGSIDTTSKSLVAKLGKDICETLSSLSRTLGGFHALTNAIPVAVVGEHTSLIYFAKTRSRQVASGVDWQTDYARISVEPMPNNKKAKASTGKKSSRRLLLLLVK